MMHAQSRWTRGAIAGTAILGAMAVLTLLAPHDGAKILFDLSSSVAILAAGALRRGFDAAPALMVGLVLATCLPVLGALAKVSRPLTRSPNATLRYRPGRADGFDAAVSADPRIPRRQPFLEIENGRGMRCAILRDMLRIGREEDNDIRISSRYVHRYHAAIHREDLDDWHITDLTGVESNGLIVNGKRCCGARLNDGDLIQLGPGRLRFRVGVA